MACELLGVGRLVLERGAPLPERRWTRRRPPVERMDRLCGVALWAADEALLQADAALLRADAALRQSDVALGAESTALVLGSMCGCHAVDEDFYRGVLDGTGASPRLFSYTLPSSPVGEISINYGIRGPALAIVEGRTAGLGALDEGLHLLSGGDIQHVLVIAADVSSALLDQLSPGAVTQDSAVALLLRAAPMAGAAPISVSLAYAADQPGVAQRRALAALGLPEIGAAVRVADYPADRGAVGALDAAAGIWEATRPGRLDRSGGTLVLVTDEHGQAAAAFLP